MDTNNPFAAGQEASIPGGPTLGDGRRVDLVAAVRDGTMTALRNVLPIGGGLFLVVLVYLASVCTCIGWMVSGPFMLHGMNRFMLSVVDGKPDFGAFTDGVTGPDPMRVFLHGWGVILLLMLLLVPSISVSIVVELAQEQGMVSSALGLTLSTVAGLLWAVVIAPLTYASYAWADRDLGALEAYTAAFAAFRPSWGALAALAVGLQVAFLPGVVIGPYMEAQSQAMATLPPDQALSGLGALFGLLGLLYGYMAVMGGVTMCWTLTAYRQVVPAQDLAA